MASPSPHPHGNIKRDRKQRQTYPGPNSADNQQMLRDIRHTLDQHQRDIRTPTPTSAAATCSTVERQDSREREHLRRSPPSEAGGSGGGGSGSPRVQPQNRAASSSSSSSSSSAAAAVPPASKQNSSNRKRQLATIRRSLRPFASAHSDPGFQTAREMVDKRALEELISLGYNEVRGRTRGRDGGLGVNGRGQN